MDLAPLLLLGPVYPVSSRGLGQRDPGAVCQQFHRFGELNPLNLHGELECASAGMTAKAVVELFSGGHREGGCLLLMKWAQPQVVPARLLQGNVFRNEVNHVSCLANLLYEAFWKSGHRAITSTKLMFFALTAKSLSLKRVNHLIQRTFQWKDTARRAYGGNPNSGASGDN